MNGNQAFVAHGMKGKRRLIVECPNCGRSAFLKGKPSKRGNVVLDHLRGGPRCTVPWTDWLKGRVHGE